MTVWPSSIEASFQTPNTHQAPFPASSPGWCTSASRLSSRARPTSARLSGLVLPHFRSTMLPVLVYRWSLGAKQPGSVPFHRHTRMRFSVLQVAKTSASRSSAKEIPRVLHRQCERHRQIATRWHLLVLLVLAHGHGLTLDPGPTLHSHRIGHQVDIRHKALRLPRL